MLSLSKILAWHFVCVPVEMEVMENDLFPPLPQSSHPLAERGSCRSICAKSTRLLNSFFPQAVTTLNAPAPLNTPPPYILPQPFSRTSQKSSHNVHFNNKTSQCMHLVVLILDNRHCSNIVASELLHPDFDFNLFSSKFYCAHSDLHCNLFHCNFFLFMYGHFYLLYQYFLLSCCSFYSLLLSSCF